jgi:hypothetical protein
LQKNLQVQIVRVHPLEERLRESAKISLRRLQFLLQILSRFAATLSVERPQEQGVVPCAGEKVETTVNSV